MRLYQQLVLFMLAATVLPLALVGFLLLRGAEREVSERIAREQRASASLLAELSGEQLLGAIDSIARAAEAFDWTAATAEERAGGLRLLYQQSSLVAAVLLADGSGASLLGPVHAELEDHPRFDEAGVPRVLSAIQLGSLSAGGKGQAAVSAPYATPSGAWAIAVAVKLSAGVDSPFVVAEIGLDALSAELTSRAETLGTRFELVGLDGVVLVGSEPARRGSKVEPELPAALSAQVKSATLSAGAPRRLIGVAKVPHGLSLLATSSVDERAALTPVRMLRKTVLGSIAIALVVLLGLGALFTRRLTGRLEKVAGGAEAFSRGELSTRIPEEGGDELTDLATTFNRMGEELQASRGKLLRWNDELKAKVEATADLRAAQAQLLEAQKLAAIGQLGAGVAHEINNPLAGILGNAQLLMLDRQAGDPDFDALKKIEQSAKRCKEITQSLLRFSQLRERPELRTMDLNALVRDTTQLLRGKLQEEGIALNLSLHEGPLQLKGDPSLLSQTLQGLVQNARTAMLNSEKKELTIATRLEEGHAVLEVSDSGKGIKPENLGRVFEPFFTTKDVWSNVGLGLSVAYRVVTEHGGKIDVASELGAGAKVTVKLLAGDRVVKAAAAPGVAGQSALERQL